MNISIWTPTHSLRFIDTDVFQGKQWNLTRTFNRFSMRGDILRTLTYFQFYALVLFEPNNKSATIP